MKITAIKRDTATINEGHWVADIPGMGNVELKVRGRSTKVFNNAFDKHLRAVPREGRDRVGAPNTEARVHAMGLAVHETVLIDWKGIEDEKGKALKFDSTLAKEWLTNPDFEHFLDAVLYAAQVVDNMRADTDAALVKN